MSHFLNNFLNFVYFVHICVCRIKMAPLLKIRKKNPQYCWSIFQDIQKYGEADFNIPVRPNDKLVLQSDSRRFPQPFAFLLKQASIYTSRSG